MLNRDNFRLTHLLPTSQQTFWVNGQCSFSLWTISLCPKTSAESIETPRKDHLDEVHQSLE